MSREHWSNRPDQIQAIIRTASELSDKYSDHYVVSLGQSPAWIVKAMQLLDPEKDRQHGFGFVPFSGYLYESDIEIRRWHKYNLFLGNFEVHHDRNRKIYHARMDRYLDFLKLQGMHPEQIVARHQSGKGKTLLLEYANSGQGLATFLGILCRGCKNSKIKLEALLDALDIELITSHDRNPLTALVLPEFGDVEFETNFTTLGGRVLRQLTDCVDIGRGSDRLVPGYKSKYWGKPPEVLENQVRAETIIGKVRACIEQQRKREMEQNDRDAEELGVGASASDGAGVGDRDSGGPQGVLEPNEQLEDVGCCIKLFKCLFSRCCPA